MNSINYPYIFQGNSTVIKTDDDANKICLHLLLSSQTGEFIDDPGFGVNLKKYIHDQNNYVLRDILIDDIYTQITTFCPQLYLTRDNIQVTSDKYRVRAIITCKNQETFTNNTYDLVLYENAEGEE